jgi:hypothetical protein
MDRARYLCHAILRMVVHTRSGARQVASATSFRARLTRRALVRPEGPTMGARSLPP